MNSATYTDNRLKNCPRLRQAFMVPQVRVAPVVAPVIEEKAADPDQQGLGGLLGHFTLQVIFKGFALMAYPLKRLCGKDFECQQIQFAH